jgi:hypothetical protein
VKALSISVIDSLDTDLDLYSLEVTSSSNTMYTQVYPGNVVKFVFDSIMLPDNLNNEPASHGYIIYEISPKSNLSDETQIKNRADIYFDFNPAVLTNTTLNTLQSGDLSALCQPTFIQQSTLSPLNFQIYPNSSDGIFTLIGKSTPNKVTIFDRTGRSIQTTIPSSNISEIDLSKIPAG